VRERERGRLAQRGEEFGPVLGWARGERGMKRKEGRRGGLGWVDRDREGERGFYFFVSTKRFKQFNSNLNSREFKLELNNKQ
jgi:hypothetical protein